VEIALSCLGDGSSQLNKFGESNYVSDSPRSPVRYFLTLQDRISTAIERIDASGEGLALVIDEDGGLYATVTDGDIRRALLAGANLDSGVYELIEKGKAPPHDKGPLTAEVGISEIEMLHLMNQHALRHLPLVDASGRVVEVVLLRELAEDYESPIRAVVMAGGFGKRMMPLTENTPKPMLPLGDKPVIERIIGKLESAGISKVNLALHYLPEKIIEYLGDGSEFGVSIDYMTEDNPLGTAGALRLLEKSEESLLVINGDIVTDVDFRAMLAFHRDNDADLTIAVRRCAVKVPYGVVECSGALVTNVEEKPERSYLVNAGIYLLKPSLIPLVPDGERFDMTDLIKQALQEERKVVAFLVHEYWLDIGQHGDYELAQSHAASGRLR
jgi:dTDP-glucose pyrophosphorylase